MRTFAAMTACGMGEKIRGPRDPLLVTLRPCDPSTLDVLPIAWPWVARAGPRCLSESRPQRLLHSECVEALTEVHREVREHERRSGAACFRAVVPRLEDPHEQSKSTSWSGDLGSS